MMRPIPPQERGAALLSVLLLVAVMSVLAVSALERLKLSTHLAANAAALDQARAYGQAAETLALLRINDLVSRDYSRTTLAGGWNGKRFDLPIPGGIATARVRDGGNCFNLNSVATGQIATELQPNPIAIAQFVALMETIGIETPAARRVAAGLADWIDSDDMVAPEGAEDDYYQSLATPYLAANARLEDVSELRAVAGVTPELYRRLRPWICALPVTRLTEINVNTLAPDQAPLLVMLAPGKLSLPVARQVLAQRPAGGYASPVALTNIPALAALGTEGGALGQMRVKTEWFALDMLVELGGAELEEQALIDATRQPARLVSRQWGEPG